MRCWLFLPMFVVSVSLSVTRLKSAAVHAVYAVCMGSFGAALVKLLWPLFIGNWSDTVAEKVQGDWTKNVDNAHLQQESTTVIQDSTVTSGLQRTLQTNAVSEVHVLADAGSEFQGHAAATGHARSPSVVSRVASTSGILGREKKLWVLRPYLRDQINGDISR